MTFSLKYMVLI